MHLTQKQDELTLEHAKSFPSALQLIELTSEDMSRDCKNLVIFEPDLYTDLIYKNR